MRLTRGLIGLLLSLVPVFAGAAQTGPDGSSQPAVRSQEEWRREYNEVAAAIDTLIGLYGSDSLERLTRPTRQPPAGDPLLLLFWADDEAEVFLNGYPVGRTRLTPTRIEIPRFYLEDHNVLRVHCWDTDSVESGFMAGLYLQDPGGGLRPAILTTDAFNWQADNARAQEIFYSHSVPDIPGANVIWGDHLFGELWLQVEFPGEVVSAAAANPEVPPPGEVESSPMEFHQIVSRLVSLETRRDQIAERLAAGGMGREVLPRYGGTRSAASIAAFTLGRAGRLSEGTSTRASERLQTWTRQQPLHVRELVLGPHRNLKGWKDATPAMPLVDGSSAGAQREDRRRNYQPPPDIDAGTHTGQVVEPASPTRSSLPIQSAWMWVSSLLLLSVYIASAGWKWWHLFKSPESMAEST